MTDGRKATLKAEAPLRPEQTYLERKAEVTRRDHEEFSQYLQEKTERDRLQLQQLQPVKTPETPPSKLNRRSILTWVAGTAVVGEAVTLGYPLLTAQNAANQDAGGATSTAPQRHHIERELINPQADMGGRRFGNWVLLMPTKLGGGTYAVNLNTGRTLAWISYWNYGDYNPIS